MAPLRGGTRFPCRCRLPFSFELFFPWLQAAGNDEQAAGNDEQAADIGEAGRTNPKRGRQAGQCVAPLAGLPFEGGLARGVMLCSVCLPFLDCQAVPKSIYKKVRGLAAMRGIYVDADLDIDHAKRG